MTTPGSSGPLLQSLQARPGFASLTSLQLASAVVVALPAAPAPSSAHGRPVSTLPASEPARRPSEGACPEPFQQQAPVGLSLLECSGAQPDSSCRQPRLQPKLRLSGCCTCAGHTGVIVAAVVAPVCFVLLVAGAAMWLLYRQRLQRARRAARAMTAQSGSRLAKADSLEPLDSAKAHEQLSLAGSVGARQPKPPLGLSCTARLQHAWSCPSCPGLRTPALTLGSVSPLGSQPLLPVTRLCPSCAERHTSVRVQQRREDAQGRAPAGAGAGATGGLGRLAGRARGDPAVPPRRRHRLGAGQRGLWHRAPSLPSLVHPPSSEGCSLPLHARCAPGSCAASAPLPGQLPHKAHQSAEPCAAGGPGVQSAEGGRGRSRGQGHGPRQRHCAAGQQARPSACCVPAGQCSCPSARSPSAAWLGLLPALLSWQPQGVPGRCRAPEAGGAAARWRTRRPSSRRSPCSRAVETGACSPWCAAHVGACRPASLLVCLHMRLPQTAGCRAWACKGAADCCQSCQAEIRAGLSRLLCVQPHCAVPGRMLAGVGLCLPACPVTVGQGALPQHLALALSDAVLGSPGPATQQHGVLPEGSKGPAQGVGVLSWLQLNSAGSCAAGLPDADHRVPAGGRPVHGPVQGPRDPAQVLLGARRLCGCASSNCNSTLWCWSVLSVKLASGLPLSCLLACSCAESPASTCCPCGRSGAAQQREEQASFTPTPLAHACPAAGPQPPRFNGLAKRVAIDIARGLAYLHARQIVHFGAALRRPCGRTQAGLLAAAAGQPAACAASLWLCASLAAPLTALRRQT